MNRVRRWPAVGLRVVVVAAALGWMAWPSVGQSRVPSGGGAEPGPTPGVAGGGVVFEGEPYEVADLGLVLYLPVGCTINRSYIPGGVQALEIEPPAGDWTLRVFYERVNDATLTAASYLDTLIRQQHTKRAKENPAIDGLGLSPLAYSEVDRTDALRIRSLEGSRAYLRVPGGSEAEALGFAVFKLDERDFLVFRMECGPEAFESTRRVFETIVAASKFDRPDPMVRAERAAALSAGERLLDSLTAKDLEAAMPSGPVLLRLYQPARTGSDADAVELGYQRVHLRTGQLGETTGRPRQTWTPAERKFGFLAVVEGRFLDSGRVIDVNASMFLSRDRQEETWNLITTVTGTNVETGREESVSNNQSLIRNGSRLTSRTVVPSQPPLVRDWVLPDRGYISGVETYLLPRLVAARRLGVPFSFYHYHTVRGSLSIRHDRFAQTATGWTREEVRSELEDAQVGVYTAEGELVRTTLPTGTVIEPIEADRLIRLWKSKGLPVR